MEEIDQILDTTPRFPETLVIDPLDPSPSGQDPIVESTGRVEGPSPPWATSPPGPQTGPVPFPSPTSSPEPSFPSIPSQIGPPPTSPFSFPSGQGPEAPEFPTGIHPFTSNDVVTLLQEINRSLNKPEEVQRPANPTGPLPEPTQYVWKKTARPRELPDRPEVVID